MDWPDTYELVVYTLMALVFILTCLLIIIFAYMLKGAFRKIQLSRRIKSSHSNNR